MTQYKVSGEYSNGSAAEVETYGTLEAALADFKFMVGLSGVATLTTVPEAELSIVDALKDAPRGTIAFYTHADSQSDEKPLMLGDGTYIYEGEIHQITELATDPRQVEASKFAKNWTIKYPS